MWIGNNLHILMESVEVNSGWLKHTKAQCLLLNNVTIQITIYIHMQLQSVLAINKSNLTEKYNMLNLLYKFIEFMLNTLYGV